MRPLALLLLATTAVAAPDAREVAAAHALLRELAKERAGLETLRATYRQSRRSELAPEPLESSGRFFYSRAAGCLLFDASAPRAVRIRLDEKSYQVYRPAQKRAERFVFRGFSPGAMLLKVFSPAVAELEKSHAVVSCRTKKAVTTVTLEPRAARVRKHVTRLTVTLVRKPLRLRAVEYAREAGETVRLTFDEVERNPALDRKLFARRLPEGTDVRITEVKE